MRSLALVLLAGGLTGTAAGQTVEWRSATGLDTGRVSVLRTNDVNPSVLWAGGIGGAYVSTDSGRSWTLKTARLPDPAHMGVKYRSMDVDRRDPDVVYAGLGSATHRTSDGGTTWSPFLNGAVDIMMALDPAHPGDFYGVTRYFDTACLVKYSGASELYETCNQGLAASGDVFAIDPTNTDTLYSSNFFKSTDGGKTWTFLRPPISVTFVRVDDAGAVWIGGRGSGDGSAGQARTLRSTDGGATWTDLSGGLPKAAAVYDLAVSPTNPSILVAALSAANNPFASAESADSGFYRTVDGGAHWYRLGGHFEALTVAFAGANGEVLVGGTAGNGVVTTDANPPAGLVSIDDVTPATGSTDGGTLVLITGFGFTPYSFVEIGGRPTTSFTFFNETVIRVRTTAHPAGLGDVVVHNADGGVAAKAGAFEFQDWAAPNVFSPTPCDPSQGLCLENGRFLAIVFRSGSAGAPPSHPVALSQKSGYFWFDFSPSVEVVFKVLDGRTIDGHYWIHWSALTEEPFQLMVVDRFTFNGRIYDKPPGSVAAQIDKTSF